MMKTDEYKVSEIAEFLGQLENKEMVFDTDRMVFKPR